jgi:hypothetical protein
VFTVALDFGPAAFNGDTRWLEIAVRTNGLAGAFTALTPRQPLSSTPYAITARNLSGPLLGSGLGEDERHISSVDADGVGLAAIQGLNQKLEETLQERDARIAALEKRLAAMEQLLDANAPQSNRGAK